MGRVLEEVESPRHHQPEGRYIKTDPDAPEPHPEDEPAREERNAENQKTATRSPNQKTASRPPDRRRARSRYWIWAVAAAAIVLLIALLYWQAQRPPEVALIQPARATITETIASSGRVGGATETLLGAQATGIVEMIFVREGDRVSAGQRLAVLKRDVAEAQVGQAQEAVGTARAQLEEVLRGPKASEIEAAAAQVSQARAQLAQQRAAVTQAEQAVAQARARLAQLEAERELAARQLARSEELLASGLIARSEYDEAVTQLRVAENRVAAEQQSVESARTNVQAAEASVRSAEANVKTLEAQLRTIQTGATPEEIQTARQRVAEAERALRVARQQAGAADVIAPFDGVVTKINAEPGQAVSAQGVLELVSDVAEIRIDVDEGYLGELNLGQEAVISSSAFTGQTFRGRVTEIAAAVDVARGTVEVTITPVDAPEWLRPGQTVNVNLITDRSAERLLVPATAIKRIGDRSVVLVVEDGRALEKPVVTRPPTEKGVPVLAGLGPEDRIIANAQNIAPGASVRVKG